MLISGLRQVPHGRSRAGALRPSPYRVCYDERVLKTRKNELSRAFVADHKILTRGFSALADALKSGDLTGARALAERLDREVGPHIAFEEEVLYPEIARHRGAGFASQMVHEHQAGKHAIHALTTSRGPVDADTRQELIDSAEEMLDHAVSCGTLLSYLTTLPENEQSRMLVRLLELRHEKPRWTELDFGN